jgi:hypothetical protein
MITGNPVGIQTRYLWKLAMTTKLGNNEFIDLILGLVNDTFPAVEVNERLTTRPVL